MKKFIKALTDEKKKQNVTVFWLVRVGEYGFTDCDVDISYLGNIYKSFPVQLDAIKSSDGSPLDSVQVSLGNVDLTLSSLILNNTIKNADVLIYEAWFDADNNIIDAEQVFTGKVDGRPAFNEMRATITTAPFLNPWTQSFPRRRITKKLFPFLPSRGDEFTWGGKVIKIK